MQRFFKTLSQRIYHHRSVYYCPRACVIALYGLQIINGAAYFEESQNNIVTTETVTASRGNILDRYGRLLVSNRISYNIEINRSELVKSEDPNGILLRLVRHAKDLGISYLDTTPISYDKPFSYVPEITDTQSGRLKDYIEHFEIDPDITAEDLMSYFREHYSIPEDFTDEEARIAAGIRYKLELQTLFNLQPYYFASDVGIDFITIIKESKYQGVSITSVPVREYHTEYAAHILGRVGRWTKKNMLIIKPWVIRLTRWSARTALRPNMNRISAVLTANGRQRRIHPELLPTCFIPKTRNRATT
jgi:penicillin-binding protein 2